MPLTEDVCIVFKDARLRSKASDPLSSNLCDVPVTVRPKDVLTWQGDTMYKWAKRQSDTPALAVLCNWESSLHVETSTVASQADEENVEVSMELFREVYIVKFVTEAKKWWQEEDPNPEVDKWKKDKVIECYQCLKKLIDSNNCGKKKRRLES